MHKDSCDHLFIMRAIIDISIKQKRETFLTFYDISKAYNNINNNDTLNIMWEKGLRGKAWRILKNLNTDLKATISSVRTTRKNKHPCFTHQCRIVEFES